MSKAVLISIQPKWCELIANGKKTIEVRKTIPDFLGMLYEMCRKWIGVIGIEQSLLETTTGQRPH